MFVLSSWIRGAIVPRSIRAAAWAAPPGSVGSEPQVNGRTRSCV